MFEFHGWFVVAETPEDQDEGGFDQILGPDAETVSLIRIFMP